MPETLYLIDGFAQIFRAYYAIRNGMRSPITSEPTHAVFGFAGMLLKLLGQLKPDYVAVAVDSPGKTFRDELYLPYKATRRETPEDLTSQIPRVFELIEGFGIPIVGVPGIEADDVIASIVQRVLDDSACAGLSVRIVSKDKDLEQLLCDRVALFDIHTDTTIDVAALLANKGITPDQVIDVLALTGDTVDNVPGVAGIGLKTAAQLVQQFGSLDGIFANIDQIKGKRRDNLEKARGHLPLSRTLVTLKRDAQVPFTLKIARARPPDAHKLIPLFQQLGFHRYQDEVRRLAGGDGAVPPLPLGEAAQRAGEGGGAPSTNGAPVDRGRPHPSPLPGGEGTNSGREGTSPHPPAPSPTLTRGEGGSVRQLPGIETDGSTSSSSPALRTAVRASSPSPAVHPDGAPSSPSPRVS
ncbi:MAG: hypothetical protein HY332_18155, partial [Chloroflexi bacterium]|nr:hypothetical protein [Chloroflexota bacterium]